MSQRSSALVDRSAARTGPSRGHRTRPGGRWRRVDFQRVIRERFGVVYHERTIGKILVTLGFSISARGRATPRRTVRQTTRRKNFPATLNAHLGHLPASTPIGVKREISTSEIVNVRFNIGQNVHFPRLVGWLKEAEDESWGRGTSGIELQNAAGAGPIAAYPTHPKGLAILNKKDFIRKFEVQHG
nr:winged helix-turn-helix domain-containing protein [Lichenihabitans psoromatis]